MARSIVPGKKRGDQTTSLFNSGSYFVVLPEVIGKLIGSEYVGTAEIELANGKVIKRKVYETEIEVVNEDTNETRKRRTHATIERMDYPFVGTGAMEKLKINPDIVRGKISFV